MSKENLTILLAQFNPTVGSIQQNHQGILEIIEAHHQKYDLIVFPELAICGYSPEDLLLYQDFIDECEQCIQSLVRFPSNAAILIGYPRKDEQQLFNSVALIQNNSLRFYDKRELPNYSVFSESRYFTQGSSPYLTFTLKSHHFGVLICEDIWNNRHMLAMQDKSIDTLISINASPFHQDKLKLRLKNIEMHHPKTINHIYLNCVGGQDEILFDGQSFVINHLGKVVANAAAFKEELIPLTIKNKQISGKQTLTLQPIEELYEALKFGLKEFIQKNKIQKTVLGLSGGIDSALTLAIAVDALGAKNVHAILMPSPYTALMSIEDAITQAESLNVSHETISIEPLFKEFSSVCNNEPHSLSSQNLQARIRGTILMAYANQHQALLLSTSNKSETAVGYCTLYGDMCGGYAVLKDVYKTEVYALAKFINQMKPIIPERVIERAPSAELAPNQTDQDDLPSYEVLDKLLIDIIENKLTEDILKTKYPIEILNKIFKKIKYSEFKRFQAAPGTKVTSTAFGKDWKLPISNGWKL